MDESQAHEGDARADYLRARDLLLKVRGMPGGKRLAMALFAAIGENDPSGYPTLLGLIPQAEAFLGEHERTVAEKLGAVRLKGGLLGFDQRRPDDCFRCAVATLAQIAPEALPDPRIDERLAAGEDPATVDAQAAAALEVWLAQQLGLRLKWHTPAPLERPLWIAVSPDPQGRLLEDHAVVMAHDQLLFDPAARWACEPGTHVEPVSTITNGGYTLEAIEEGT